MPIVSALGRRMGGLDRYKLADGLTYQIERVMSALAGAATEHPSTARSRSLTPTYRCSGASALADTHWCVRGD